MLKRKGRAVDLKTENQQKGNFGCEWDHEEFEEIDDLEADLTEE